MALLEVKDVHTFYGNIEALKGVSIEVEEGECVTLIGSNGAGGLSAVRAGGDRACHGVGSRGRSETPIPVSNATPVPIAMKAAVNARRDRASG